MSLEARAWLPPTAFALDQGRRAYDTVLEAWSRTWFASASAAINGVRQIVPERAHAQDIVVEGGRMEARLGPRGKRLLFETICAVDLSTVTLGDTEHALVEALVRQAVADLLERAGAPEATLDATEPVVAIGISLAGRDLLTLTVALSVFAERLKSVLPRQPHPRPPLVRRQRALGPTILPLEANLGRGSLTLAELRTLAAGDIVLLDQSIEEGVALAIVGTSKPIICGRPGRNGNRPALNL